MTPGIRRLNLAFAASRLAYKAAAVDARLSALLEGLSEELVGAHRDATTHASRAADLARRVEALECILMAQATEIERYKHAAVFGAKAVSRVSGGMGEA